MSHWRNYDPIDGVMVIDGLGGGPLFERLLVTANVHPSALYPEQRVQLHLGGHASGSLAIAQIDDLVDQLQRARTDVVSSVPSLHPGPEPVPEVTVAVLIGSRCESCCLTIRLGSPVHIYDDAIVHAGPCPGEERDDG